MNRRLAAQAAARAGISLHRAPIYWRSETPDWDRALETVRVHDRAGIRPFLLISGTPGWAAKAPGGGNSAAPRIEAWRAWIRQLGAQFKGREIYWEIWNEPDIGFFSGTTDEYLEMLPVAHEELAAADAKNFHVMTGGFASISHGQAKPRMR